MGEYAEAAIWAEMNGRDPSDMSPEDWMDFYAENEPADASMLHFDARMMLEAIDSNHDDDAPTARAETLAAMFPALRAEDAAALVRGLEALAALPDPDDSEGATDPC